MRIFAARKRRYKVRTLVALAGQRDEEIGYVYERIGNFDDRWLEDLYLVRCPDGLQLFWYREIAPVRRHDRRAERRREREPYRTNR